MDTTQVRLALTDDPEVLNAMKRRGIFKKNRAGKVEQSLTLMFDAIPFTFVPGIALTLDESIADSLYRQAQVIVDTDDNGPYSPMLKRVARFKLGEQQRTKEDLTVCPICQLQCHDVQRLSRHIAKQHAKADLNDPNPAPNVVAEIETEGLEADEPTEVRE